MADDRDSLSSVGWPGLLESIQSDAIVPFLGPGLGRGLLPSPEEIAERLVAGRRRLPLGGRGDLPAVSQCVEIKDGKAYTPHYSCRRSSPKGGSRARRPSPSATAPPRGVGLSQVVERLAARHFAGDPGEPHAVLADLPLSTYVTTNYDPFLAAALRRQGKRPLVERCRCASSIWPRSPPAGYKRPAGTPQEPLVFHMYGNDEDRPASLVLTEDDYLDFVRATPRPSPTDPWAPRTSSPALDAMLVFLGYDVRRLDCPRPAAGRRRPAQRPAFARPHRGVPDRSRKTPKRPKGRASCGTTCEGLLREDLQIKVY